MINKLKWRLPTKHSPTPCTGQGVVQKVEKEVVGGYPRGDLRFFVKPSSRKENLNTIGA
jgi:hypothetical protein